MNPLHPNSRVMKHAPRLWRVEVRDESNAPFDVTGPPFETKAEALTYAMSDQFQLTTFGEKA